MMGEKEKYELVWASVERYGKDWTNPALANSIKRWITGGMPAGSTVTDFGCGNGSSLDWLNSVGYCSHGVEIASNACDRPDVTFGDLREIRQLPASGYGLCTDLMEHIPTDDVDKVLKLIASTVDHATLFVIARDEDKDGRLVGKTLHLTRKNKEWWDVRILEHFKRVQVLHYDPDNESAYCFFAYN